MHAYHTGFIIHQLDLKIVFLMDRKNFVIEAILVPALTLTPGSEDYAGYCLLRIANRFFSTCKRTYPSLYRGLPIACIILVDLNAV